MKLICPKCHAGVSIGGASRFDDFQCRKCDYCFMGLEAEVRWMFGLPGVSMMTGCPYCWTPLELRSGGAGGGGYVGPHSCYSCGRKLPQRPKRRQGEEWYTDNENLARSLVGYSCTPAEGAELIRRIEALGDNFSPAEIAELRGLVNEAIRRGTTASVTEPSRPPAPAPHEGNAVQFRRAAASDQWYYTQDGGQRKGPVLFSTLQQLAQAGQLRPTDMVWTGVMSGWTPASAVIGLFLPPGNVVDDDAVPLGGEGRELKDDDTAIRKAVPPRTDGQAGTT